MIRKHLADSSCDFKLGHPFTALLCGPSGCGKTTLMKNMLQKNSAIINPPPQRIVWLYKRWQPMYDIIKSTVSPSIEFIQGIPPGIDQPTFFNPKVNNLLIIDDLMSSCGDDPRMTEIFYEGSHHRSLSVALLCQNLYYSKSPTQRRNSHYVILFKNPNDLQSVMTFAKQVNPTKTKEVMQAYETATAKPHGYLLLDFKQTTNEQDRLKANIFDEDQTKEDSEQINSSIQHQPYYSLQERQPEHFEEDKMVSCDYCGTVLDSIHDLQRHLTTWCPLNTEGLPLTDSIGQKRPGTPHSVPTKIPKLDRESEHKGFSPMRCEISRYWAKVVKEGQQQYEQEGCSKKYSKARFIQDNIKEIRKDLREAYVMFIKNWMKMNENSAIHQKIMGRVEELHDQNNLDWKIFKVSKRYRRGGLSIYKIVDFNGNDIQGTFYQDELQKVTIKEDQIWKIDKILKQRKKGKKI